MVRRSRFVEIGEKPEPASVRLSSVFGFLRTMPAEKAVTEFSETDALLQQSHDLVAQLREAVGRPHLDL